MTRRTKIICTIGPQTSSYESLQLLAQGGMNIARLNMSHGTYDWHGDIISKVKKLNQAEGYSIGIMIDTKGPEIRSGDLKQPLEVKSGDTITFTTKKTPIEKDKYTLDISYDGFVDDVEVGDIILVDSGIIDLLVLEKNQTDVICKCLDDGTITSRRHLNIKGRSANLPTITDKDWLDIDFAINQEADFIALSFTNSGEVVTKLKVYLTEKNSKIKVVSKIESTNAVTNLEEIVVASDGIMVARGDLGAELPIEDVPIIQKRIVSLSRHYGKPVIVATQMLESMIQSPTPTRAEVTDIFNAVYQRADAIMMSGETANGKYPHKALEVMARVAARAEENFNEDKRIITENSENPKSEIAIGASVIANNIMAKAIIVFTKKGITSGLVSQCRPNSPIFSFTDSVHTDRSMSIFWGVNSVQIHFSEDPEKTIEEAIQYLENSEFLESGDQVVIISDIIAGKEYIDTVQIRTAK